MELAKSQVRLRTISGLDYDFNKVSVTLHPPAILVDSPFSPSGTSEWLIGICPSNNVLIACHLGYTLILALPLPCTAEMYVVRAENIDSVSRL